LHFKQNFNIFIKVGAEWRKIAKIRKMKKSILFLTILELAWISVWAETRVYKETVGKKVIFHNCLIEPTPEGYFFKLTKMSDQLEDEAEFELDSSFSTLKWTYRNPKKKTAVTAYREGNIIFLSGAYEEKNVNKKFKINDLPWKQILSIDLEKFVAAGEKDATFWAIGVEGPSAMKITELSAKVKDEETISVNEKEEEAIRIRISMTGIMSVLWHGDYWFRKSDYRFVRYEGDSGPGTPRSIIELIQEEQAQLPQRRP